MEISRMSFELGCKVVGDDHVDGSIFNTKFDNLSIFFVAIFGNIMVACRSLLKLFPNIKIHFENFMAYDLVIRCQNCILVIHFDSIPKTLGESRLQHIIFGHLFFCGQGSNLEPCIYYVLFISTELNSR
jgi:hypothetical protein